MKLLLSAATLLLLVISSQDPARTSPNRHNLLYSRAVVLTPATEATPASPRACVTLDGSVFIHALPTLADLRLFTDNTELPYVLTLSEAGPTRDPAAVLNRGLRGRHVVFDLRMPSRPYTHVDLDLNGENFLIDARVTGLPQPGAAGTLLGAFTLFDLARQNLGRNTILPLPESTFPYLHIDLNFLDADHSVGVLDPAIVRAASVPPSREAETLYTPVEESTSIVQHGRDSIATFKIPAHLPVERVSFTVGSQGPPNFSRTVSVRAKADGDANAMREEVSGQISRIKLTENHQSIRYESLAVPATVGSNGQGDAHLEVAVDNGDDQPLALTAVRLEMRQRKLCFDDPGTPVDLLYGNPTLTPPVYDYGRLFDPATPARAAQLNAEYGNPLYQPPPIRIPPLTERHPELLWIALLAVAAVLGTVAFFSSRRV